MEYVELIASLSSYFLPRLTFLTAEKTLRLYKKFYEYISPFDGNNPYAEIALKERGHKDLESTLEEIGDD